MIAHSGTKVNLDKGTQSAYHDAMSRGAKTRLDVLLADRGLAESRERAQALVLAGQVLVNGQVADKPGMSVAGDAKVLVAAPLPYVSRGGTKLAHGLDSFGLDVAGCVALDAGASTGGFTDCLLQRGAARVYAVDVGTGQLAWRLRQDPRVVVLDRTNIRYLESLPEPCDLAVADLAFISLRLALPAIWTLCRAGAQVVVLVKPQFEAGRDQVGKGGVVRDPAVRQAVVSELSDWAAGEGWQVRGVTESPITGPAGNVEYLLWLTKPNP